MKQPDERGDILKHNRQFNSMFPIISVLPVIGIIEYTSNSGGG